MVRRDFRFIAGAMPLDFLNTEIMSGGERVDLLDSADALKQWLKAVEIDANVGPRTLREARSLRAILRTIFKHIAAGKPADLEPLNHVLGRFRGRYQFRSGRLEFVADYENDAVWQIARAAAELVSPANRHLIRTCEGTGCILFFYDMTKSHSRRWCSMATCGNRMKAALYYERSKTR